jgi:hypothetical protein
MCKCVKFCTAQSELAAIHNTQLKKKAVKLSTQTAKKEKEIFPVYKKIHKGIACKAIYEEGLPEI